VNRLLLVHLGWSALVLAGTTALVAASGGPCPPGGPLGFDCGPLRDLVLRLLPVAAVIYVALLSAVVAWGARLARRPNADSHGGRDWYLVAAVVGVPIAPLLAFTLLAGLGWLG
jgi:hypothetical protein